MTIDKPYTFYNNIENKIQQDIKSKLDHKLNRYDFDISYSTHYDIDKHFTNLSFMRLFWLNMSESPNNLKIDFPLKSMI